MVLEEELDLLGMGVVFFTERSKLVPVEYNRSSLDIQYDCTLDVPRSEINPHYIDSQLDFDGETLELVYNFSDGTQCVEDSWSAIFGPYGNGSLPDGSYLGDNLRTRIEHGFSREGVGFSIDLNPRFQTTRTLLRIHPDGGISGTLGCIGIQESADRLNAFYNVMNTYFQRISTSINVIVD